MSSPRRRFLDLVAVNGLAVALPLFDVLSQNATFFVAHRARAWEILLLVTVILAGLPVLIVALESVVQRFAPTAALALHSGTVAMFLALAVAAPVARSFGLSMWPTAASFTALVVLALFALRLRWASPFLTMAALGAVLVAGWFVLVSPVRALVLPGPGVETSGGKTEVPVVVMVFDEFSVSSLLTPDGDLDRRRLPGFARLAETSTWYRSATTVSSSTHRAVPAILTGTVPDAGVLPIHQEMPRNLFTMLARSHRLVVDESVTRLCPNSLCARQDGRDASLTRDSLIVALHVVLPTSWTDPWLPEIGDRWTDFTDPDQISPDDGRQAVRERVQEDVVRDVDVRFDTWLASMDGGSPAGLWYLHLIHPHLPYRYLPNGQQYPEPGLQGRRSDGTWSGGPFLTELATRRYLLQVGDADRRVGMLLDQLGRRGLLDDALVIVTADHGVAFRTGEHRRQPTPETLPEIAAVPMFVKLPGQVEGRVDDRPVQIIDLLPTIAAELRAGTGWSFDGVRLSDVRDGRRVFFESGRGRLDLTSISPLPDARRMSELLGSPPDPFGATVPGSLIGTAAPTSARPVGAATVRFEPGLLMLDPSPSSRLVPALMFGDIEGLPPGTKLALAANGTVAGVGEVYSWGDTTPFAVLVDPSWYAHGPDEIVLYTIEDSPIELWRGMLPSGTDTRYPDVQSQATTRHRERA